jgi:23S rRNA pseudouridine955/2504/2580 synthase
MVEDVITRHENKTEHSISELTASKQQKIKSYHLDKIKQMILFEDDNWIVWNKPAGIVTHPGKDHDTDMSLHDIMKSYLYQTNQAIASDTFNPSFCFRLDKDTSGIIISAKTYAALQRLNEQIRERKVSKNYLTIVAGSTPDRLRMEGALSKGYDRDFGVAKMEINKKEGKDSLTTATTITQYNHPRL